MTISVTPNGDGTYNVTCGSESVVVGSPKKPPPKLSGNRGAITYLIADGALEPERVLVRSVSEIPNTIRDLYKRRNISRIPAIIQLDVLGSEPLEVGVLNEVISEIGNPDWMRFEIVLLGAQ